MPDYARLFPPGDFRWHMGLRPGDARVFFAPTDAHESLIAERARWLREMAGECALLAEGGFPLLEDACLLASEWGAKPDTSQGLLQALGMAWEADFVLLSPGNQGFSVEGGVICFPSHWTLREKLGRTLDFTHSVVPGLNEQFAPRISIALGKLTPGAAWLRENWGLSRDAERNHHPRRSLRRLDATIKPEEVHLRIEHQCLTCLPRSGGILFGIRLTMVPWLEVVADPAARTGLQSALATMSTEAATYKGLQSARSVLLDWLSAWSAGREFTCASPLRKARPARPA